MPRRRQMAQPQLATAVLRIVSYMGLIISALREIPSDINRKCWIYLLDYGLNSEVSEALRKNFVHFAERSSEASSVVVLGSSRHVQNDILSWHRVFGLPGDKHLPALLVCTVNPNALMDDRINADALADQGHKAILIPLSGKEITVEGALLLVDSVFDKIVQNDLDAIFATHRVEETSASTTPVLMLEPNISGIGINLNELWRRLSNRRNS